MKNKLKDQLGQLDFAAVKSGKVGPNIPPMFKRKEAELAIHSVPDKFKGTDVIKEAGFKGPSLDKVKGTTYEYRKNQQLDLFKALKGILDKKE